ncbi:glycosyltransferase [Longimicrobium sp.]|jgi:glycosyltransferase involved in cell wall biosynthesis|uniref:glycosyltransferase n=1 Tax=Longimicrobium sp. TaxID=2029185 RepID=UPI002ED96307
MRVTLLSSNVSLNSMARAQLLAELLSRDFEVQVLGTAFGDGVWEPARGGPVPVESVPGGRWPGYASTVSTLLAKIRGDVVYAVKPLFASFGVALLHRRRSGAPVVLDIDDDELSFRPAGSVRQPRRCAVNVGHPDGRAWTRAMLARTGRAERLTVAGEALQARYGGTLVPHAKDTARLQPRPEWRERARARLGAGARPVVMFMGTPRVYSGVEDAAEAVRRMRHAADLVVAGGDPADPFLRSLKAALPGVAFHPPYRLDEVPLLLEAADVVVVPQRMHPQSAMQVPSKLLDAMAMARPAVGTAVSDIPAMLAGGRGLVVPPSDPAALAAALDAVLDAPEAARDMGLRARRWCERHASYDAVRATLRGVIEDAAARRTV